MQRHKNSFQDMLRGSPREKDDSRNVSLNVPAPSAPKPFKSLSDNRSSAVANMAMPAVQENVTDIDKLYSLDDHRFTELEKALAASQDQTAALRQELERVKQDAQASVEVSKYQAIQTHRQATPESAMEVEEQLHDRDYEPQRQNYGREEDLIGQNHELRYRLAELQDQLIAKSAHHSPETTHSEADWDALTLRLHETKKESHARLQQLLSLKSSISSLTRIDLQVSDSELAESFLQLANRVREWVVSNYRRTKLNLHDLPETIIRLLRTIKIEYEKIEGADKLALYQAVVSHILMRIFNEPMIVGMPERGLWADVREFSLCIRDVGTDFHEWRRTTLRTLEKSDKAPILAQWKAEELQKLSYELERIMLSIASTELTSSARATLVGILNTAVELKRTLCMQKARYRVFFFDAEGQRHNFDTRMMEAINDLEYNMDENGGHLTEREFLYCVFPCLEKIRDDIEIHPELGNIVFKARVCCGVG